MASTQRRESVIYMPRRRHVGSDPRFILGVLLVTVSIALTTFLIYHARGGEDIYQLSIDVAEGQQISTSDLTLVNARVPRGRYIAAGDLPDNAIATRAMTKGELLPVAAVSDSYASDRRQVVISVANTVPSSVVVGSHVEVWAMNDLAPGASAGGKEIAPTLVSTDAIVRNISDDSSTLRVNRAAAVEVSVASNELSALIAANTNDTRLVIVPKG